MTFTPKPVSPRFRFDWQFAIDVCSNSLLQEAALLISVTPLILEFSRAVFPSLHGFESLPIPLWLLWGASVAFVIAYVVLHLFGPKFVLEYRDFGQYALRQHSHRWIVWEFYLNLPRLSGWQDIVRETSSKDLTTDIQSLPETIAKRLVFPEAGCEVVAVSKPVNINRDIYLPICFDGKKQVLAMLESDQLLMQKEKELFWILYTQAAKEKPIIRVIFWSFFYAAVALVAFNVVRKVYQVIAPFI